MKLPSTVRKTIDLYIAEKNLDKKSFYGKLMPIYERIQSEMDICCDCGGKANSLAASNLTLSAAMFAFYDATDRKLSVEKTLELVDRVIPESIPIVTYIFRKNVKTVAGMLEKHYTKLGNKIEAHKANGEWLDSWTIEVTSYNEKDQSVIIDLIGCPIVKYAKKYGYMEFMPALCGSDFITIRQFGTKLIRPGTEAEGYPKCAYTYVPDKK